MKIKLATAICEKSGTPKRVSLTFLFKNTFNDLFHYVKARETKSRLKILCPDRERSSQINMYYCKFSKLPEIIMNTYQKGLLQPGAHLKMVFNQDHDR